MRPERETVTDQSQGVQLATIQELARYWGTKYDWRKVEARLNALPQFITEIDGLDIHFIHVRSKQIEIIVRCAGKQEGWLFPSSKEECGYLTTVAKQFREARRDAGLPESLVLYCARHSFGTAAYEATGNLAMVMKVMGHTDVHTSMRYQHPGLESLSG
jgi:integrase